MVGGEFISVRLVGERPDSDQLENIRRLYWGVGGHPLGMGDPWINRGHSIDLSEGFDDYAGNAGCAGDGGE